MSKKSNENPPNEALGMIIGLLIAVGASIIFDSIPIGIIVGIVVGSMISFYSRKPNKKNQ
ncbi:MULTISPECIES: hypothetical protein [Shouchella]|uniref:Uncharacterized protein n=3 Tax=Bacillaceae TaxID=186817 RepID=A0A060M0Y5_9BACI|nr:MULTISPECIES: hypothetical protein [Bacillaceae]RQW21400.1 hypothetical protein EH196_15315 [Bacillus sp. C1-1]AIC95690.1 hypothetical protein BleG1_3126 [Shouchella lehensis G1]KQL57093.1 hypothetical protein AN965_10495 [Alkalicoccobacillus plakortidis]MBG9783618.1 hypothetical protein [Shouchella lehensis]TES51433.1 hypothetical protein E2L03_05820 [Shouchella lehensis]